MATWSNAAGPITPTGNSANYSGYTIRLVISAAQLSNTGLGQVRVTYYSSSTEATTIDKAYIGPSAMTGDTYDAASLTQLLFSGSPGFALSSNSNIVSDAAVFSIPASTDLILTAHISGDGSHDDLRTGTATGYNLYYKAAVDEAGTANVTGYSLLSANLAVFMLRVEVAAADGGNFFPFF